MDNKICNDIQETIKTARNDNKPRLLELIESNKNKPFIIYGAGRVGKNLFHLLAGKNIRILSFIDRAAADKEECFGVPVYNLDNASAQFSAEEIDSAVVLIALATEKKDYAEILGFLRSLGFKNLYNYFFLLRFQYYNWLDPESQRLSVEYYQNHLEDICTVAGMFCEEESRKLYFNYLSAFILQNEDLLPEKAISQHYFPDDIVFSKGYTRFIDCGAYDGDTLRELYQQKGKVDKIACFEPEQETFSVLKKYIEEENLKNADEIVLFPCGLQSKNSTLHFQKDGIGSSIMKGGEEIIQCVAIDDVLIGFAPTFIKMDIEGAEYEALLGARKTIAKYKPDLAISVYHYADDIWNLPLLISRFGVDYTFYLRSYSSFGSEIVLYAISK